MTSHTSSSTLIRLQAPHGPSYNLPCAVLQEMDTWEGRWASKDVYGTGDTLQAFEAEMAVLLGKPAGLFFVSGTSAQQAALAQHVYGEKRTPSISPFVLVHPTSHLLIHEDDAIQNLLCFNVLCTKHRDRPLQANDVEEALHTFAASATKGHKLVVMVEVPHREIGGSTTSLEDLHAIRALVDAHNEAAGHVQVALHCDGARLFEVMPFYAEQGATCVGDVTGIFDSIYVSFYKGIGAVTGSILCGRQAFIEGSKIWRHRYGGALYSLWPFAMHCQLKMDGMRDQGGVVTVFHKRYARMGAIMELLTKECQLIAPGARMKFSPPRRQSSMVHCWVQASSEEAVCAARDRAASASGVEVFTNIRETKEDAAGGEPWFVFEWSMGEYTAALDDDVIVRGWKAFMEEIQK